MADNFLKALKRSLTGGTPLFQLQAGVLFGTLAGFSWGAPAVVVPAATPALNLTLSNWFKMTYTADTVCAIQLPTGVPAGAAALFAITIINTAGVALTNTTFVAAYKQTALTFPATANNRTWLFLHDGTNAYEVAQTAADAGN